MGVASHRPASPVSGLPAPVGPLGSFFRRLIAIHEFAAWAMARMSALTASGNVGQAAISGSKSASAAPDSASSAPHFAPLRSSITLSPCVLARGSNPVLSALKEPRLAGAFDFVMCEPFYFAQTLCRRDLSKFAVFSSAAATSKAPTARVRVVAQRCRNIADSIR